LPKEVIVREVEFILIPEGWFYKTGGVRRGTEDGGGNVRIWLDAFYIAKYEARARDLERYLNAVDSKERAPYGGDTESCSVRIQPSGKYGLVKPEDDLPANHLSWRLADEWARWMGFRLPSEAEWEKAARGDDQRTYPWGNDSPDETYANFAAASSCLLWPVTRMAKGRSPYGVYNMSGNVREYVADWVNPEVDSNLADGMVNPAPAPRFDDHPLKIMKGGRWASNPQELRIQSRNEEFIDNPFNCNGTRFAMDAAVMRRHIADGTARVVAH
jgi:iron(II)-dependent oxidoreductase